MTEVTEQMVSRIFGTTDPEELKTIAEEAEKYRKMAVHNVRGAGRKDQLNAQDVCGLLELTRSGKTLQQAAAQFHITRQTAAKYLRQMSAISEHPDATMRMNYMDGQKLCTRIDVNFRAEKIYIENYTDRMLLRAFGINENPSWEDFMFFLEDRCLPRTRAHLRDQLREMCLDFYDPLSIVEKTKGRMAGDGQWIQMIYRKEKAHAAG